MYIHDLTSNLETSATCSIETVAFIYLTSNLCCRRDILRYHQLRLRTTLFWQTCLDGTINTIPFITQGETTFVYSTCENHSLTYAGGPVSQGIWYPRKYGIPVPNSLGYLASLQGFVHPHHAQGKAHPPLPVCAATTVLQMTTDAIINSR